MALFLWLKYSMIFKLTTVVDITQTNARRGDDQKLANQQANYNTLYQTIGLRVNIDIISVESNLIDVTGLGFGSNIKGKHKVWSFFFNNEYEGALSLEMLISDFNFVPVIGELDNTYNSNLFNTTCSKDTNIVFEMIQE